MQLLIAAALCCAVAVAQRFPTLPDAKERIRSSVIVPNGAVCDNLVPAFFVTNNVELVAQSSLVYSQLSEERCLAMCVDNVDVDGRAILCASVTYDHIVSSCTIQRSKSQPDGILPLAKAPGRRYFEKFCLPETAPVDCGERTFRRVKQYVLVGFARNVTIQRSLADCAAQCLSEGFECRSAMYFYDEGECITNTKTSDQQPQLFAREDNDNVVYFENGCLRDDRQRLAVVEQTEQAETKATREKETATRNVAVGGFTAWSDWTTCDRPDGRRIRRRKCKSPPCKDATVDSQWCADVDVMPPTTTTRRAASAVTATTTPRPTTTVPALQRGWGEWGAACAPFGSNPECINGGRIGFQSRVCRGNPFLCQGPFFRYCTIPC